MRIQVLFIFFVLSNYNSISQQNHLDVEGHTKIRGNIDINHAFDTTSVYIGRNAGVNNIAFLGADLNTFVGSNSGNKNLQGLNNSFFGATAGYFNLSGSRNSFFGSYAGYGNTMGSQNSFFGSLAGYENVTGTNNSFFGKSAGFENTTGSDNSFFGLEAGYYNAMGTRNTFIGKEAGSASGIDSLDRSIAIGHKAKVACSHCAVIGGTEDESVNVGIGTTTPFKRLDVIGEMIIRDSSKIATFQSANANSFIEIETNGGTTGATVGYFDDSSDKYFFIDTPEGGFGELVVLANGNVGIGKIDPGHPIEMASGAHVTAGGAWTNASSRVLKENICVLTVEEAISTIAELNPVKFNYKTQKDEEYIGFIAEDVPDLVATQDRKSLSPMDIAAVLSKVVQNQQLKLGQQDAEIMKIKKEMEELKSLLKEVMVLHVHEN